jgi:hypothetical protein
MVARRFNAGSDCKMSPVPEGWLKCYSSTGVRFRRADGTRVFSDGPPATEVAGYYQWSLRDHRDADP